MKDREGVRPSDAGVTEAEFRVAIWVLLGTELISSARAVCAINSWPISPTFKKLFDYMCVCVCVLHSYACVETRKKALGPSELELQAFAGCLACDTSAWIWTSVLMIVKQANGWAIFSAATFFFWGSLLQLKLDSSFLCSWGSACAFDSPTSISQMLRL